MQYGVNNLGTTLLELLVDSFVILLTSYSGLAVIDANPFLQKVQKQLSSRLQRMPEMYSVTSVLNAWVRSG